MTVNNKIHIDKNIDQKTNTNRFFLAIRLPCIFFHAKGGFSITNWSFFDKITKIMAKVDFTISLNLNHLGNHPYHDLYNFNTHGQLETWIFSVSKWSFLTKITKIIARLDFMISLNFKYLRSHPKYLCRYDLSTWSF